MTVKSAKFIKAIVGPDEALERDIPQVVFIGRSNVGKSSLINALTRQKGLAKTSSFPGRTTEIILFLINKSCYFLDLPGYGFAKASKEMREKLQRLIDWYFFESHYQPKIVVLIIDANVGCTENDLIMLKNFEAYQKNVVIVANKVDKIKKSTVEGQLKKIQKMVGHHRIIPCSTKKNTGVGELCSLLLAK